jgi:putative NADH-flavin reductase
MPTLAVIGASKGIGLETVREALKRGHTVRGLARRADTMEIADPNFIPIAGDALKEDDVRRTIEGADAVIMALGVPKSLSFITTPTKLFSGATEVLLPLMREAGIKRLLVVTGFGSGASEAKISMFERLPFKMIFGRAYADKSRQEALLDASDLDWTVARPGVLTSNRGTGRYRILTDPNTWHNGMIARADVAHFLLDAFEQGSHIREAPVLIR